MQRDKIVQSLLDSGAVAVIRMSDSEKLMRVAEAIHAGGISALEITMTTPNALEAIEELARAMGEIVLVGVGSVLNADTARQAIDAGAQFVVSPIFKPAIIQAAHAQEVPALPGAFSPTEIQLAHEAGADIVKVFPADVLGMAFFKAVKAPLPHLKLMPTGGVSLTNAGDWLRAGACAVGVGSALLDKQAIQEENYSLLTENAKMLNRSISAARELK
ncbi:MAG: bifunctional 4-hydroxy-2-oxoglutarate aldolase/2-dehydro-3-deoxy-phosphogluconate aldolase [bacterium]